jgi:hypothetical protein
MGSRLLEIIVDKVLPNSLSPLLQREFGNPSPPLGKGMKGNYVNKFPLVKKKKKKKNPLILVSKKMFKSRGRIGGL